VLTSDEKECDMEKTAVRVKDLIRVVSIIHDIDVDKYFIEVEFRGVGGELKRFILERGLTGQNALKELFRAGATIPHGSTKELMEALGAEPDQIKRVTGYTGWHGSSFVLPDMTIGPDAKTLEYRQRGAAQQEQQVGGSLEDWRAALKLPCRASSYIMFGTALGYAGPLLRLIGQDEGAIFFQCGESSTGKSLSELGGESVIKRAVRDELLTHDITERALEEAAATRNDLLLNIDELDRYSGSEAELRRHVRTSAHKLTGGGGRQRSAKATQDASLANLHWLLNSLWSGERPLDDRFLGEARQRGEMVRLAEIPVPRRKKCGVFDRLEGIELSTADLAKRVEQTARTNFGHPIRAFLKCLVEDPETYKQQAQALVEKFIRKVGAQGDPWTQRFATKFGVVYAAACITAEMKIAPWSRKHAFSCVARLYRRALNVVATPEEAMADLLHRLAQNATSKKRFPVLKKGKALPKEASNAAWGFRRKTSNTPANLAIHSDKFDKLVRPRKHASQVRKLLAAGGYTLPGKEGRFVTQIKVKGFGSSEKPYFIRIRRDRLTCRPTRGQQSE
jgi:putative DNA primase/helicase